ncbi:MAG: hypothetical protein MN733_34525, partial [Nitrososphaera sp.]|nr:hypothetical protein [Nitrososphaera sp.]
VISGFWKMEFATNSTSSSGSTNGDVSDFHAMIAMVMLNGSAMHSHEISNFTQSEDPTLNSTGNSTTYVGSSIVTMREGPVSDVDTQIVVSQDRVVEIQLDPASLDNHFGDTPIYGLVITHEMISEFMEKTMIQEHMNNATGIMSEMWK